MRRSKLVKEEKELKRCYGKLAESMEAYYHHLDLRPLSEMDDTAFAYLVANVKGIIMLDLNETEITNESIKLLTRLEYVKELRLKGIPALNDDCIEDLNKINELEFLHVKNTGITINGLLKLKNQHQLKTVLFSADDLEAIKDKMLQLKAMHPGCEFIIDGKTYYFEDENDPFRDGHFPG